MGFLSFEELSTVCEKEGLQISEVVIRDQMQDSESSREEVISQMKDTLAVMKESAKNGIVTNKKSISGLSGGDAYLINKAIENKRTLAGPFVSKAIAYAVGTAEINAGMGKIVAAPTAGSCGIIPGVLMSAAEEFGYDDEMLVKALFCAGGIGSVIAERATLAGAEGGCQAECGSASAMAAGALCELAGGTPRQCIDAASMAIKSIMGLVCDPVAGLVEIPCIKRNASGASLAITCAELALAGVSSYIPADEVIDAMSKVGGELPNSLKETAEGGLAATKTGKLAAIRIHKLT